MNKENCCNYLKKSIAVILCVLTMLSSFSVLSVNGYAFGETYKEGYYTYEIIDDYVKITDVDELISGDVVIPDTLGGYPVVSFAYSLFAGCDLITSIVIPDSVTDINTDTFNSCKSLQYVDIGAGVTCLSARMFYNCDSIETITLGENVSSIGERTFANCDALKEIIWNNKIIEIGESAFADDVSLPEIQIPDTVLEVGTRAFSGCISAKKAVLGEKLNTVGENTFANCVSMTSVLFNENLRDIGAGAFENCKLLKEVEIPNKVIEIGYDAFRNCSSMATLTIGNSVVNIGEGAFENCIKIENVIIPDSVVNMGKSAFEGCTSLKTVKTGKSLVNIPQRAFYDCQELEQLVVGESVITIDDYALCNCISLVGINWGKSLESIGNNTFGTCKRLSSVIFPSTLSVVEANAFHGCEELKKVVFNENITEIGCNAFSDCEKLEEVIIPDSTVKLSNSAFEGCTSVKSVVLGKGLEIVSGRAFYGCDSLEEVYLDDNILVIEENVFGDCENLSDVYFDAHDGAMIMIDIENGNDAFRKAKAHYDTSTDHYDYENLFTQKATCVTDGYTYYTCPCGHKKVVDTISATGKHTYKNGECVDCGAWQYKNTAVKLGTIKNTTSGVNITWSKLAGADKYAVYRKTTGGWTKLTTNATGTSFTDKTAKNNVKYTYTVRAINGTEYNTTYNKTGLKITFMSAPKISKVENTASGVKVTWGKVSGATSYNVYRKTTGGWTKLGSTKSTSFTDTKAKAGTKYTYTIIAVKSGAKSSYYGGKAIVRLTVPKLTKLNATSKKNTLTYGKVTGATSYIIYRKTGNGGWQKIATTKSTKYVDTKIKKGTYYTYTVRAVNGSSTSYYNTKGLKVRAK